MKFVAYKAVTCDEAQCIALARADLVSIDDYNAISLGFLGLADAGYTFFRCNKRRQIGVKPPHSFHITWASWLGYPAASHKRLMDAQPYWFEFWAPRRQPVGYGDNW